MKKILFLFLAVLMVGCEQPTKVSWNYRRYIDTIQVSDSVWVVNAVYIANEGVATAKILTITKEDGK